MEIVFLKHIYFFIFFVALLMALLTVLSFLVQGIGWFSFVLALVIMFCSLLGFVGIDRMK